MNRSEAGKLGSIAAAAGIKAKKDKNISDWNLNPKLCKNCQTAISYEKRTNDFCNHTCAAIYNNSGTVKNLDKPWNRNCLNCEKAIKGKSYCNRQCQKTYTWNYTVDKLLKQGFDDSSNHRTARKYLIEKCDGKCQICNLKEWMGKPMPLVLDHINGDSSDGDLNNLRIICNNCDAQTDTYKSKNIGKGRAKRRQRYKEGKSY